MWSATLFSPPAVSICPSSKLRAFRPQSPSFRQKHKVPLPEQQTILPWPSNSRKVGFVQQKKSGFCPIRAMDANSEHWSGERRLLFERAVDSLRELGESCPQPVKNFPWSQAVANFFRTIFELVVAVVKYLCVPLLAISSLSEMSYCAHERKMTIIPIPFLIGIAGAGVLKETALDMSPVLKEEQFPWHLLSAAIFFTLIKLPGPYYPYWVRLVVPHFANGGLWRTLWFAFQWSRRNQNVTEPK